MDQEARNLAEMEIDDRMKERLAYNKRIPAALQAFHDDFDETDELRREYLRQRQREQFEELGLEEEEGEEGDNERYLDIEEAKGKLHIWIKEPRTVRWIRRSFKKFR